VRTVSIATSPTDSRSDQRSQPADSPASQRAELLGQIFSAQAELEHAITEASSHGGDITVLKAQMQTLGTLLRQVGKADAASLAGVRASVTEAIAQARSAAEQRVASAATSAHHAVEIMEASAAARRSVDSFIHDFYETKKFEPYLSFSSPEDEKAYRDREAQRRTYIENEHAKGTPQGDLNASNAAIAQMHDAGAHGADKSPEFQDRLDSMEKARDDLRGAMDRGAKTPAALAQMEQIRSAPPAKADELSDVMAALRDAGVRDAPAAVPSAPATYSQKSDGVVRTVATSGRG